MAATAEMARYYVYYSNKLRGSRKKTATDGDVPALIESDVSPKELDKNRARLIPKIGEHHTDSFRFIDNRL